MSRRYKAINSIDDIDISRITLGDINQRYIDEHGNRFATRFNIRTRKIQIVRIALGEDEAKNAKGKLVEGLARHRKEEREKRMAKSGSAEGGGEPGDLPQDPLAPQADGDLQEDAALQADGAPEAADASQQASQAGVPSEVPLVDYLSDDSAADTAAAELQEKLKKFPEWVRSLHINPNENVHGEEYIREIEPFMKLYSERIFGVIGNLDRAGVLTNREGHDDVLALTNVYDLEITPNWEKVKNRIEEFVKYPRTPESYMNEVSASHMKYLDTLPNNEKMDFLKPCLVSMDYLPALEGVYKLNEKATSYVNMYTPMDDEDEKNQAVSDARSSVDTVNGSLREQLENLTGWLRKEKVY